jgi:hypothetical protein
LTLQLITCQAKHQNQLTQRKGTREREREKIERGYHRQTQQQKNNTQLSKSKQDNKQTTNSFNQMLQTRTTPTPYKNSFKQKSEQKEIQPTTHNSNNKSLSTDLARRQKGKFVQETKGGKKKHTRKSLLACLLLTHKLLQIL